MRYHHYIELLSFLTGIFLLRKSWPIHYKVLVVLAGFTFGIEMVGQWLWNQYKYNNNWIYNLFIPLRYILILFFLSRVIVVASLQRIAQYFIVVLVLAVPTSYIWHHSFFILNNYVSTLCYIFSLAVVGLYFMDSIINDVRVHLYKQPAFWFAAGLFFFCSIFIVRHLFWNYINLIPDSRYFLGYTNNIANTFLYGGLTICFICLEKTRKYYLYS